MNWYMHTELCKCRRSFYVVDGACNRCGERREKPQDYLSGIRFSLKGRDPKGRHWDKKQHRVI